MLSQKIYAALMLASMSKVISAQNYKFDITLEEDEVYTAPLYFGTPLA